MSSDTAQSSEAASNLLTGCGTKEKKNVTLNVHFIKLRISSHAPCAVLLCGCDNTVVDGHGSLDRLTHWYHDLLLVLRLHNLLVFICHWNLAQGWRK